MVHHNNQRISLCTRKLLGSDLAAGDAITIPRVIQLPIDSGEGGRLALRVGSQPRPSCTFDALPPPPLFVASFQIAALARAAIKGHDDSAHPAAADG